MIERAMAAEASVLPRAEPVAANTFQRAVGGSD